jgi:post-segregation antitoxin (ccd killing protein)
MPKYSLIPNRTTTCVTIDAEKLQKAKELCINLSNLLDEALTRELNPEAKDFYNKAIANQNEVLKKYLLKTGQTDRFDDFKYNQEENNVLEKSQPPNRQATRRFEGI